VGQARDRVVDEQDVALAIDRVNDIGRVFHQGAPLGLGIAQRGDHLFLEAQLAAQERVNQHGCKSNKQQTLDGLKQRLLFNVLRQQGDQAIRDNDPDRGGGGVDQADPE
jgi:hypothetical protein